MNVFSHPDFDHHQQVAFVSDAVTGLQAIIAVHNTALGPAVGGCRMYPYASSDDALTDVLRLSRGMTYKSAMAGLPMGGGKSVIIGDPHRDKSPALFHAMGRAIAQLGGLYVAAEDSGTTTADLKQMQQTCPHISGTETASRYGGDPSPYTALGTFVGMRAALRHRLGVEDFDGVRVAVQGVGSVGYYLTKLLIDAGASVIAADVNAANLARVAALGAITAAPDYILQQDVDIVAPCALGGVINDEIIPQIRAPIVAGAANNQLATPRCAQLLAQRGILYAPDFVINAGGIIDIYYQRTGYDEAAVSAHVLRIENTLDTIFACSASTGETTDAVACRLAEGRINASTIVPPAKAAS